MKTEEIIRRLKNVYVTHSPVSCGRHFKDYLEDRNNIIYELINDLEKENKEPSWKKELDELCLKNPNVSGAFCIECGCKKFLMPDRESYYPCDEHKESPPVEDLHKNDNKAINHECGCIRFVHKGKSVMVEKCESHKYAYFDDQIGSFMYRCRSKMVTTKDALGGLEHKEEKHDGGWQESPPVEEKNRPFFAEGPFIPTSTRVCDFVRKIRSGKTISFEKCDEHKSKDEEKKSVDLKKDSCGVTPENPVFGHVSVKDFIENFSYIFSYYKKEKKTPEKIRFRWSGNTYEIKNVNGYRLYRELDILKEVIFDPEIKRVAFVNSSLEGASPNRVIELFCESLKDGLDTSMFNGVIKCIPEILP